MTASSTEFNAEIEAPMENPETFLRGMAEAAISAALPARCLAPYLADIATMRHAGRTVVVGAGKAAAAMAQAAEDILGPSVEGLVITRDDHALPTKQISVRQAAHPVPDARGVAATAEMLGLLRSLGPDDLVICLLSGGASSLLVAPAPGIDLETKQRITSALLRSGASITEINTVRKHLSAIKGGRLLEAASPAKVITLAISDVTSNDPAVIGSGPTVPDSTSKEDARAILAKYAGAELKTLNSDSWDSLSETPKAATAPEALGYEIVASAETALSGANAHAAERGIACSVASEDEDGEAGDAARVWARKLLDVQASMTADSAPQIIFCSGEFTVTHEGSGAGGPNQEFLLALAIELDGAAGIWALSIDTDGIDGASLAAGGVISPDTLIKMVAAGVDPKTALERHESAVAFDAIGAALVTGPTYTNVNDFRAFLIASPI